MKRMLVLIFALLLLLPNTAMAHSKLQSSTPVADSTLDAVPGQIEMTFNTEIESLSNFKLFNAAGEQVETGKATVSDDTMTGSLPPDLTNGVYTVKWTIIGSDSHSVEGEFSFTVNAPELSPSPSPEASPSPSEVSAEPSPTPEPAVSAEPEQAEDVSSNEDSANESALTPVIIIGVIIVAVAVLITLLRRRKP